MRVFREVISRGERSGTAAARIAPGDVMLRGLFEDLQSLSQDRSLRQMAMHRFSYVGGTPSEIRLDAKFKVRFDGNAGVFIVSDNSSHAPTILATNDRDVLVDWLLTVGWILAHPALRADSTSQGADLAFMARWRGRPIAELERTFILATLGWCNNNRTRAASSLGISLRTLRNKLRAYLGKDARRQSPVASVDGKHPSGAWSESGQ